MAIETGVFDDLSSLGSRCECSAFTYHLDNIGNREATSHNSVTNSYLANSLNQYTNIVNGVTNSPSYDDDGNMLTNGDWTYTWNGENRLVSASNATKVLSFKYDYMGRRFEKTSGADTTSFLYDGWNMVRETSSSVTNSYVWGLDLSQSLQGAGGVGGLLLVDDGSDESYPVADANGNITGYIDESGTVVAVYVYDAFGGVITSSGIKVSDLKLRFSTKPWDEEIQAYSFIYRYYHPDTGRWLSRDPIGETFTEPSLYSFVLGNPLYFLDYLGQNAMATVDTKANPPSTPPSGADALKCQPSYALSVGYQDNACCKATDEAGDPPSSIGSSFPTEKTYRTADIAKGPWRYTKICFYKKVTKCIGHRIAKLYYELQSEVPLWTDADGLKNLNLPIGVDITLK